jgi:hypothetical protein
MIESFFFVSTSDWEGELEGEGVLILILSVIRFFNMFIVY